MVAEVVGKARNRLQFGSECQPSLLARQSLLKCSIGARGLEDFNIVKAVDVFEKKWNKKVCFILCIFWLKNGMVY